MKPHTLRHCILSHIAHNGRSTGYEMSKRISLYRNASHQHVYRALNNLEDQGYLVHEMEPQHGRQDKKYYSLTDKGQHEIDALRDTQEINFYSEPSFETALDLGALLNKGKIDAIDRVLASGVKRLQKALGDGSLNLSKVERCLIQRRIAMLELEKDYAFKLFMAASYDADKRKA